MIYGKVRHGGAGGIREFEALFGGYKLKPILSFVLRIPVSLPQLCK
jgi:hypothetical protein